MYQLRTRDLGLVCSTLPERTCIAKTVRGNPKSHRGVDNLIKIVPEHLIETLSVLLHLEYPEPYVWRNELESSFDSLDQQHLLLLASFDILDSLAKNQASETCLESDLICRLTNVFQQWKAHVKDEISFLMNQKSIDSKVVQNNIALDQKTIDFFNQALQYPSERYDDADQRDVSTTLVAYLECLGTALKKAIYRHVVLTSCLLNKVLPHTAILLPGDQTCGLTSANKKGSTELENGASLFHRSSLGGFNFFKKWTKNRMYSTRRYLTSAVAIGSAHHLFSTHLLKAPNHFKENLQGKYHVLKLRLTRLKNTFTWEQRLQNTLHSAVWEDISIYDWEPHPFYDVFDTEKEQDFPSEQDDEEKEKQKTTPHTPSCTPLETKRSFCNTSTASSSFSKSPKDAMKTRQKSYRDMAQRSSLYAREHSVSCTALYDNYIDFQAVRKSFQIATLLIDIQYRRYCMIRGDIQLRNMTLYQPWHLAGQQFEFLICKNRKPQRHEAVLLHKIKLFFKKCSQQIKKNSFSETTSDHLVERLTIKKKNDTSVSVIAVFFLVVALDQTFMVCFLINETQDRLALTLPNDSADTYNFFFVWLAKRLIQAGHLYERLFAEPFL